MRQLGRSSAAPPHKVVHRPVRTSVTRMAGTTVARILGGLIALLGMGFVVRLLWQRQDELVATLRDSQPVWLVLALVCGLIGMGLLGWVWRLIVIRLGSSLEPGAALRGFYMGQLGKYVPGGVWAVVGQGEWARREGVPSGIAYLATLLSMATAYTAAGMVTGVLALIERPTAATGWLVAGVAAIGPIGLGVLHPRVLGRASTWAGRVSGRDFKFDSLAWPLTVMLVVRQVATWLFIGVATWATTLALGGGWSFGRVLMATCASWTAGFLLLPVPGGIGIREAAFASILGGTPLAAGAALAARLVFILVDVVGALLASAWSRGRNQTLSGTCMSEPPK